MRRVTQLYVVAAVVASALVAPSWVHAQSFSVQCPATTALHPGGKATPGAIKCQQVSGGDGFATMGDGNQIFLFGFGPLSGLADIQAGLPGTETAAVFNSKNNANRALTTVADIMNTGVMNAESPAPLIAIDEDDELFLTLTNVGMIMRPDLFEQHTIHFHGYPNASSFFDGVPDASVAINIGGSFTYYYTAPDAGTYFWHCHIAPPEHLQMGMVGQLYVRPRQNRVKGDLYTALMQSNLAKGSSDGKKCSDILCTNETTAPIINTLAKGTGKTTFAYDDGDGSTQYDVEYPIQIMGFDPDFHFVGMTFNPEGFADMKDRYHMLSGRTYPDTVYSDAANTAMMTEGADGKSRPSQPVRSLIVINKSAGQNRALLRISDLSVTNFTTLATIGIPMTVIAQDARLLRDSLGNNMYYKTNSITIGGGQSTDVILDATKIATGTYFLYSTNLDHLSNDAENFGGQMTEIHVQ